MPDAMDLLREGRQAERLGVLSRALEAYRDAANATVDPDVRIEALIRQAAVHRAGCEWDDAIGRAREAQQEAQIAALPARLAEAVNAEALVHVSRGDFAAALPLLDRVTEETPDVKMRGIALQNIGTVNAQQGDLAAAELAFAESYRCFVECGYERGQAIALNNQGRAALDRGDRDTALHVLEQALQEARDTDDSELIGIAMINFAEAILPVNPLRAESMAASALGHFRESRNTWRMVESLRMLGSIHEHRGSNEEATRCYERALAHAREIGAKVEITTLEHCISRLATG